VTLTVVCSNCGFVQIVEEDRKRRLTLKHRQNISAAKKGKPHSDDHKQKIRMALLGRPHSEEHKNKIAEALRGNKNAVKTKSCDGDYK